MCCEKYLAIDVGGTAIKYTLTDKNAKTIKINEIKTIRKPEKLFESLDEIIRPHLNQIAGIALSFPGKINAEHGIVNKVATFDWICDMPLKSILEEKYKKPVWIENDGKCAALAELWKGNLSDVKNGVVMGLGTEIAGGIIINGSLYRGSSETAGEFSSILTDFKNPDNILLFFSLVQVFRRWITSGSFGPENKTGGRCICVCRFCCFMMGFWRRFCLLPAGAEAGERQRCEARGTGR